MRKIYTLFTFITITVGLFAQRANLYTIPNQSAQFIRMPSRGASTEIDAVFFNPAGLPQMGEGVFFSINNQILNQKTIVTGTYEYSNPQTAEFPGAVSSFIFPNFYAAYNTGKMSLHGGFLLVGGAGGAEYDNLPLSDRGIADIAPALQNAALIGLNNLDQERLNATDTDPMYRMISDYRFNFKNEGLGFSPAVQVGMAYQFNKIVSGSLGLRWSKQVVRAEGQVTDIEIYSDNHGGWQSPGDYLRNIGDELDAQGAVNPDGNSYGDTYSSIGGIYDKLGADRYIDVKETGSGLTPILGVHITPNDKLSIGMKYEFRTKMTLTTEVTEGKNGGLQYDKEAGMQLPVFEDEAEYRADLPATISGGISYQISDKWKVNTGGRYMFLKNANMDGREKHIDKNYFEVEIATEYQLFEKFALSGGYTYNRAGVNKNYQNDIDFWLPGHSFGLGGKVDITKEVALNLGGMFTKFQGATESYDDHAFADGLAIATPPAGYEPNYTIQYEKFAYIFAIGLDFSFGKKNTESSSTAGSGDDTPYYYRAQ